MLLSPVSVCWFSCLWPRLCKNYWKGLHGGRTVQGTRKILLSFGTDPDKGADRGSLILQDEVLFNTMRMHLNTFKGTRKCNDGQCALMLLINLHIQSAVWILVSCLYFFLPAVPVFCGCKYVSFRLPVDASCRYWVICCKLFLVSTCGYMSNSWQTKKDNPGMLNSLHSADLRPINQWII